MKLGECEIGHPLLVPACIIYIPGSVNNVTLTVNINAFIHLGREGCFFGSPVALLGVPASSRFSSLSAAGACAAAAACSAALPAAPPGLAALVGVGLHMIQEKNTHTHTHKKKNAECVCPKK